MPRIKWITDEEATGEAAEAIEETRRRFGAGLTRRCSTTATSTVSDDVSWRS